MCLQNRLGYVATVVSYRRATAEKRATAHEPPKTNSTLILSVLIQAAGTNFPRLLLAGPFAVMLQLGSR
jgi:hypothetical protein